MRSLACTAVILAMTCLGCDGRQGAPGGMDAGPDADAAAAGDTAEGGSIRPGDASAGDAPDAVCADCATRDPVGTWYLNVGGDVTGERETLLIAWDSVHQAYVGMLYDEATPTTSELLTAVTWDAATGRLVFSRDVGTGTTNWFDGTVVDGVITGRLGTVATGSPEPGGTGRPTHFTGWNAARIDQDTVPRVWELTIDGTQRARLRIDRADASGTSGFVGTLKVYASVAGGGADEQAQYDVDVMNWDGSNLVFATYHDGEEWFYTAVVSGRQMAGQYTTPDATEQHTFTGVRAEVLSHGITARSATEQASWQTLTRARLRHLMMADDPAPIATAIRFVTNAGAPIATPPFLTVARDDALEAHPQNYLLSELYLSETLANPYAAAPIVRTIHLYLAVPTTPMPTGGYPVALAVNGHFGSGYEMMAPDGGYWYGDAFARRGYVVAAVDISHRPVGDRHGMYSDELSGDDIAHGNGLHPAVESPGMDSDWEEDGERAWDAMRALDLVLARTDVNPTRVVGVGHSMGGSITTVMSALEPRITLAVPSGYTPDLGDLQYGIGHTCWRWLNGDAREYIDASDYHALIAPRGLIVETGETDISYSMASPPFAGAKQVMRRAFAAYGDTAAISLVHFLHPDGHLFHVADLAASSGQGVTMPSETAPIGPWDLTWQTDPSLVPRNASLFDLIDLIVPPPS